MHASGSAHVEIVRLLLGAGADTNLRDSSGTTALFRASRAGHAEVARLLLEAGANQNLRDEGGMTALMCASSGCPNVEVVRLLLDADADASLRDNSGNTALTHASRAGHFEVERLLLEAAAHLQSNVGTTNLTCPSSENV